MNIYNFQVTLKWREYPFYIGWLMINRRVQNQECDEDSMYEYRKEQSAKKITRVEMLYLILAKVK